MNRLNNLKYIVYSNKFYRTNLLKKYFSNKETSETIQQARSIHQNIITKYTKPDSFIGDLQEVLKLSPRNFNVFFFTWSISCRVASFLLVLLLL